MRDMTQEEYDEALYALGFERTPYFPGHVCTKLSNGETIHICEAAAEDMFPNRRERLADLIETREWEENNGI